MPMIRMVTNLADVEVPKGFELRFADVVSKSTGKPREVIAVEIAAGARLIQGGTNDPVAVISIESIGAVSDEDNIRHSAAISAIFQAELGIPKQKVIISFHDMAPGKVAIDGTTVANATPSQKSGKGFSSRIFRLTALRRMPMIRVATNLADSQVPIDFEVRFTDVVSKSMGKPRERIAVEISAGARLVHGGTREPVAVISIQSIGAVSDEDNIRHAAAITAIFQAELGLPKDKVIISFFDLTPGKVAIEGTTVANANANKL